MLMVSAKMSERPAALLHRVQLPGLEWISTTSGETSEEDGAVFLRFGDETVPIMELSDRQALRNRVFYSYNAAGYRTSFVHKIVKS